MAEMQDGQTVIGQVSNSHVDDGGLGQLKLDLQGYRQLLLPFNKVLEWEESHYPAVLVGSITFVFAIVWFLEPSVLTCFSLTGLILCLIDFVVPTLTQYFFSGAQWTEVEERQYERICRRLLNARTHFGNAFSSLMELKNEKPKFYLVVMMGIFAITAWIGSLIDNLLLTYLLVVFIVLVPGLRKHGVICKMTAQASDIVKNMITGDKKKAK